MTKPLDLYRAKREQYLRYRFGERPLTDAELLVAMARELQVGTLTLRELREMIGEAPMSVDELLDDAAKYIDNPNHQALVIFHSHSDMTFAVERQKSNTLRSAEDCVGTENAGSLILAR